MNQIGKILILTGLVIVIVGTVIILLGKIGITRLPGDIEVSGKNWKFYFPVVSCIAISVVLTFVMWIISRFMK